MQEAIEFLNNNILDSKTVVVATSGGPDSMCLLSLVCKLDKNLKIICAHVNHKVRSESDSEAKMVEEYCHKNNITFELKELEEFASGEFSEELARKKRYEFFKNLINDYQANYLLTAHHGDDLVETILMRITRGSTLSGYIGIRSISKNNDYTILRPLLYTNKEEILKYNQDNNIPYALDSSNTNTKYTRNRYRHFLLQFLKKENPSINKKYLKFSNELREYELFVNNYIKDKSIIVDNYIVINKIKNESSFIKRKAIELLIKDIQGYDILNINDNNMDDLLKLIDTSNKSIDLNNNYQAINSYGKFYIEKKEIDIFKEIILDKDIETEYFKFYYNSVDGDTTNNSIYLLSNEITLPLKLRAKQDGDKMLVKNLKGSKKVKDIFIDSKIPYHKRASYPILVDSNNVVLWIPGLKKSQFSKDISQKYDIIVKCEARRI